MAQFIGWGNGHDGAVSSATGTINSYAAMTATAGDPTVTTALSVSVDDYVILNQTQGSGAGYWEIVKVASTGAGSFEAVNNLTNSYGSGAQAILVPQYTAGTLSNTITATDWNATVGGIIALAVNGKLTVTGTIEVDGHAGPNNSAGTQSPTVGGGFRGGRNDYGGGQDANCGEGYLQGPVSMQTSANGNGGGAGTESSGSGGYPAGSGGGGGLGTAGGNGIASTASCVGGTGGVACINSGLTLITLGGGGGGGSAVTGSSGGCGGSGGGAIIIFCREIDTSAATIHCNGGTGGTDDYPSANAGGGSGSGGAILIKTILATLGTNKIVATGGASIDNGGVGGSGRIHIDYASSYTGTTNPTLDATKDTSLADPSGFVAFL